MRIRYLVAALAAVLATVTYFTLQSSGWILVAVTDSIFAVGSGTCSLLAFLVCRQWGFRGKMGIVNSGLFLGVFLWFLSDISYVICEAVLRVPVLFPSIGNGLELVSYVPIALGLAQFLWVFREGFRRVWTLTALGIGVLALCLGLVVLVGPLIASAANPLDVAFYLVYPVLDLILLVLALLMVFAFAGGKMTWPWVWISFGLILTVLADISQGLGQLQGWYYSGNPIELISLCAYICFALGLGQERRPLFR